MKLITTGEEFDTSRRGFLVAGDRRNFLRLGVTGVVGAVVVSQLGCSPKSVNAEIQVAETFLRVVAVEIPNQKPTIEKILKVADDFNADYQRGDFVNATAIFANLEADVTQLISDVGVNLSSRAKMALVFIDAAVTAIADLLKSQRGAPGVPSKAAMSTQQKAQAEAIESRAGRVDKLFAAIRP